MTAATAQRAPAAGLVARARDGDSQAWDTLVDQYAPLVWSVCHRYRLGRADTEDVSQSVWLRLVAKLDSLREPEALPGWLRTSTERRCLTVLAARNRMALYPPDLEALPDQRAAVEQELLAAERRAAVRAALDELPPRGQLLMSLLTEDPPRPYVDIAARLGIPVGSIGPTRRRYLDMMRRHPAVASLGGG